MSSHATCPYRTVPDFQRWNRAFTPERIEMFDPYFGQTPKFNFTREDRIATAGSCFAQNIAKRLRTYGYNYVMAEYDNDLSPEENEARGNTMFSARYGNIYTVAHLVQLLERAYGRWQPEEDYWKAEGRFFDPYRPSVDAQGFATIQDLEASRELHFRAVRNVVENSDVFIFTLGLTEGWINKKDGAAYPICPGCGFGTFDANKYEFRNYSLAEISAALERAIAMLSEINPALKIILTVSPVPLAATMEPRHVLLSTSLSKSILRVACDTASRIPNVDYFASHEIVNWGSRMSSYFSDDLRSISDAGIDHVMRVFFKHYANEKVSPAITNTSKAWCDDDLLLVEDSARETSASPITASATNRRRTAEEEEAEAHAYSQKGQPVKKHQVTRQRQPHPYLGWKAHPHDTVLFGRKLDDLGFYNSRNIADFMTPNFKRVCVLGPSLVMDLENEEPDTICGIMQREFQARGFDHVFVYNCGIHASVSSMDLSNLLHYVADLRPDVIVTLTGSVDLRSQLSGDPRPGYPQSFFVWERILNGARLEGKPPNVTASVEGFDFSREALRKEVGYGTKPWLYAVLDNYKRNIHKFRALARGFDFGYLAATAPTFGSYRNTGPHAQRPMGNMDEGATLSLHAIHRSEFHDELTALHQRDLFFSRDLSNAVDDLDISIFKDFVHMHAPGYERLARKIVDDLIAEFPTRLAQQVAK
jgi:hypothetical protein